MREGGALEVNWLFCVNTRRPWSVINSASNGIIDGGTSSRGALEWKSTATWPEETLLESGCGWEEEVVEGIKRWWRGRIDNGDNCQRAVYYLWPCAIHSLTN